MYELWCISNEGEGKLCDGYTLLDTVHLYGTYFLGMYFEKNAWNSGINILHS